MADMKEICYNTAKMNYYTEERYDSLGRNRSGADASYYKNCVYYTDLMSWAASVGDVTLPGIEQISDP
jgi:hypothetical protein